MSGKMSLLAATIVALIFSPNTAVVGAFSTATSTTTRCSLHKLGAFSDDNDCQGDRFVAERRSFLLRTAASTAAATAVILPTVANAGIDPAALKALPVDGDATGSATRLRQLEAADPRGARSEDTQDIAFEVLPNGASFRNYREGKGEATVGPGSKVAVELTARCKSFATNDEPGGVKYFSTKADTDFNELAWTVGDEAYNPVPKELEEAMMGMKKGGLRRIEVPSTAVFAARNAGRLPLPSENNKDGKRRFDRLFKTDATLLFEVLVTRVK